MNKKNIVFCFILFLFSGFIFASESAVTAYLEGCKAFSRGDWSSAVFLLKKAAAYDENNNADTYYMLIAAEIYAEDNKNALNDCDDFLKAFPTSVYVPRIQYMKGKLLYSLGEYEKSIVVLSDFCHRNEENELYPSALFYIAECLFTDYKYDEAEAIYERIVTQYPASEKVAASQFRIENIAQRSREEKLLYLLKQTGEEYLSAKEDYEKQLKLYNSEAINTTREKLADAQQKNRDLEDQIRNLENQIATLKAEQDLLRMARLADLEKAKAEEMEAAEKSENPENQTDEQVVIEEKTEESPAEEKVNDNSETVRLLKAKAFLIQQLMNEKKSNE